MEHMQKNNIFQNTANLGAEFQRQHPTHPFHKGHLSSAPSLVLQQSTLRQYSNQ